MKPSQITTTSAVGFLALIVMPEVEMAGASRVKRLD